jgi:hypothetical protein
MTTRHGIHLTLPIREVGFRFLQFRAGLPIFIHFVWQERQRESNRRESIIGGGRIRLATTG